MGNIIIGVLFIIGGISGQFVLRGTNSSGALIAIGVGLIIWGLIQVLRKSEGEEETTVVAEPAAGSQSQNIKQYDDIKLVKTKEKTSFLEGDVKEYYVNFNAKDYVIYNQVHTGKYYMKDATGKKTSFENYDACIQSIRGNAQLESA